MTYVPFATFTRSEDDAVDRIVARAQDLADAQNVIINPHSLRMDLSAIHHHTPLDVEALSEADDFNFAHDVFGIIRHIDRRTGLLTDQFLPRFAR